MFGDEIIMEPVEEKLANSCSTVDLHNSYAATASYNYDIDEERDEYMNGDDNCWRSCSRLVLIECNIFIFDAKFAKNWH